MSNHFSYGELEPARQTRKPKGKIINAFQSPWCLPNVILYCFFPPLMARNLWFFLASINIFLAQDMTSTGAVRTTEIVCFFRLSSFCVLGSELGFYISSCVLMGKMPVYLFCACVVCGQKSCHFDLCVVRKG